MTPPIKITDLLSAVHNGDRHADEELMPLVYSHLRQIAGRQCAGEWRHRTLRPTDLLHETYLRLIKPGTGPWQSRWHFFAVAARAMRQVLVDHARAQNAQSRGGGLKRIDLDHAIVCAPNDLCRILAVDQALKRLAKLSRRQTRIVELRYFGGLSLQETASALGISVAVVKSDWTLAKAWLRRELRSVR